jgi:prophage DNA circulation protein
MAKWPKNIRKCTFRGVKFDLMEDHQYQSGRRLAEHEYPQRDIPTVDDLGRSIRKYRITGRVVGLDYATRRDALIGALEKEGPGTLVHPTLGKRLVRVDSFDVSESTTLGSSATFNIQFVEAGQRLYPSPSISPGALVSALAATAKGGFLADFVSTWKTIGQVGAVVTKSIDSATAIARGVTSFVREVANPSVLSSINAAMSDLTSSLKAMIRAPGDMARAWQKAIDTFEGNLGDLADTLGLSASGARAATLIADMTATEIAVAGNTSATWDLVHRTVLATAAEDAISATYATWDEAMAAATAFAARLEAIEADCSADTLINLARLRGALSAGLRTIALDLPRVRTWTPPGVTSTPEIAEAFYGDGSRASEIAERNAIVHPGFVPATPLTLLTE